MAELFSHGALGEGINPFFLTIAMMMFIVLMGILSQQISKLNR